MRHVVFLLATLTALPVHAAPSIVAAENMYGDVAAQVAGPDATVTSILSNPNQDPHLFEATPAVARALAGASVVICNGAGYDPWMDGLLAAGRTPGREVITAATLMGRHPGDNPHLWYDPATLRAVAAALAAALAVQDPPHAAGYAARAEAFAATLDRLDAQIAAVRARHAGVPVAATEPVFGLMGARLGLVVRDGRFALAVMNGTEPRVSDTAAFEDDLRRHRVRALLYNGQTSSAATQRLLGIARAAGVPVVPVTETEPAGTTYQAWMATELDTLDRALSPPASTPQAASPQAASK